MPKIAVARPKSPNPLFCAAALAFVTTSSLGSVMASPRVEGDLSHVSCRKAATLAQRFFLSARETPNWHEIADQNLDTTVVFARDEDHLIRADPDVFERLEWDEAAVWEKFETPASIAAYWKAAEKYWQREAAGGLRIVVLGTRFNWAGRHYALYVVDQERTKSAFMRDAAFRHRQDLSGGQTDVRPLVPALGENRWHPPTVLRDEKSQALWVIDVDPSSDPFATWRVSVVQEGGFRQLCRIALEGKAGAGLDRLPPAVRRFASLVDQTLGSGRNDGTLQATARIRKRVSLGWKLVSDRPWALSSVLFNSRVDIEHGLQLWAEGDDTRKRHLTAMRSAATDAASALAAFYVQEFGLKADEVHLFSEFAIDHMLRRHFVFPRQREQVNDEVRILWPATPSLRPR